MTAYYVCGNNCLYSLWQRTTSNGKITITVYCEKHTVFYAAAKQLCVVHMQQQSYNSTLCQNRSHTHTHTHARTTHTHTHTYSHTHTHTHTNCTGGGFTVYCPNSSAARILEPPPQDRYYTKLDANEVVANTWRDSPSQFTMTASMGSLLKTPGVYTVIVWRDNGEAWFSEQLVALSLFVK